MAAVIHSLWERGDKDPLILPAHIPIDDPRVRPEITRYLSDNWVPVLEKDVDGPNSLPLRIDREVTNLGKFSACRRVDKVPLWRGDHVAIKQLAEDYARYNYLSRLKNSQVLTEAIRDGLRLLTWPKDSFAYADSLDDATQRYRGLRAGELVNVSPDGATGLLVKPEVALKQIEAEKAAAPPSPGPTQAPPVSPDDEPSVDGGKPGNVTVKPRRFHGTVSLDPARVGRDASKIAEE